MSKTKRCRCALRGTRQTCGSAAGGCTTPCIDVCANPICADPTSLSLMAPVIYDQLGLNLCSPVTLEGLADFPTATSASVQIIDVVFGEGTEISPLNGRPNCYEVSLANLTVTFAIRLFDCCGRYLTTLTATAIYLPPDTADNYDEETNPDLVQFDLFAPYGISYAGGDVTTPLLNYIGFSSTNNDLVQGLNVLAYAKLLSLDLTDATATIGLTIYVASVYYAQYQFGSISKPDIPKISPIAEDDSLCQDFVEGDLLNLAIKPLELGIPHCDECLKRECGSHGSCCSQVVPIADDSATGQAPGGDEG